MKFIGSNGFKWRFSVALELSSRILALGLVGISLSTSIEKNRFVASLIQQLKVPVAIAYSILVAVNFLTLIQTEYERSEISIANQRISGSGLPKPSTHDDSSDATIGSMHHGDGTAWFSPDESAKNSTGNFHFGFNL